MYTSRLAHVSVLLFFVLTGVAVRPALAQAPQLQIVVNNPDGSVNNGSVPLGVPINIYTHILNGPTGSRSWKLQGAGKLASIGPYSAQYTPPVTMPGTTTVSITASVPSENLTATYKVTLINPVPTVSWISPSQALAGTSATLTLSGKGFVPGTTVVPSMGTAKTQYTSYNSITTTVTLPQGATGNVSLTAKNAGPGGGSAPAYQLSIGGIQEIAKDPDGTNTGTARLGVPVNITTTNTDVSHKAMSWSMQGAGTLKTNGTTATYIPPQLMPANTSVTVTAHLTTAPSVTTSYSMTLLNPVPVVSSTSPTQLLTGGTQKVTLTGSGFTPATTVVLNGTTIPVSYINYNSATVQIPVLNHATGTLNLQVQNPGAGATSNFTEKVAPTSIVLTATDDDGTNTGTARVASSPVNISAVVSGSLSPSLSFNVTGAGSISSSGVYTPPAVIPANPKVTVHAWLQANSDVAAAYSFNLINPAPTIASATPLKLPAGKTTSLTLTGSGFLPTTAILVNGKTVKSTYVSPTEVVASIPVPSNETGDLMVRGQNPAPGGGTGDEFAQAIAAPVSVTAAARLLDQTTFGPTTSLIQHVQQEGATAWLSEQFNTPTTLISAIPTKLPSSCGDASGCQESEWWKAVLTGNDQLRQRVAFALSEIFVVSSDSVPGFATQSYANTLVNDAFTNWYTIMTDVARTPAMGIYLNMLDSAAPTGNLIANENFARENMQLFNMGTDLLNQDGSVKLDQYNNPYPAYTEANVEAFARVFTGWTYANSDGSKPGGWAGQANYALPMVAIESYHDKNAKILLNTTLAPGQSAEQDFSDAEMDIFQHPNVPPFVCKQLIQHLIKSNPSPQYVSRVADVFVDDGNGVRGDMKAVLTAIFTDPEARAGDTDPMESDGHLREPILWLTAVMRNLGFVNVDPSNYYQYLSRDTSVLSEQPYASPSVFNFFPPSYEVQDPLNQNKNISAPEFALENTANVSNLLSLADKVTSNNIQGFNVDLSATSPLGKILASQGSAGLVQALSDQFLYGTMDSTTAASITSEMKTVSNPAQKIRLAVYLTITSSPYKILH